MVSQRRRGLFADAGRRASSVAWIDQATDGAAEPEHPAPTLELVAPGGGESAAAATVEDDAGDGTDTLAIVALVVGAFGLIVAGIALVATRRAGTRRMA